MDTDGILTGYKDVAEDAIVELWGVLDRHRSKDSLESLQDVKFSCSLVAAKIQHFQDRMTVPVSEVAAARIAEVVAPGIARELVRQGFAQPSPENKAAELPAAGEGSS